MLSTNELPWLAALDGTQIVAVQHGCGANHQPVNCNLDEYLNWTCPNCGSTYGAAMPLAGWADVVANPLPNEKTKP